MFNPITCRVEKTCKQHKHACGTLSDSPGTLWLSAFKIYIFEQNSTKFQKKSLYNITIFILFMHSSLIVSVYMSDFMCIYLKKPRNTQWYSKCLWNASSLFSTLISQCVIFFFKYAFFGALIDSKICSISSACLCLELQKKTPPVVIN